MVRVPTASTSTFSDSDDTSSQIQDQSIILRDSENRGNGITNSYNDNDTSGGGDNDNDDTASPDNNGDMSSKFYEQQIQFDQISFETTLAESSFLVWTAFENHKELVLGTFAAFSVFLTVVLVFIINRRASRTSNDKTPLVNDEQSVNIDVDRLTIHV